MIHAIGCKPPGIAWFSQFFVPIGKKLGSIDLGLHLAILVLQYASLVIIYWIGRELSPGSRLPSLCGCAMVGSAPLFVGMSHQYMTEPLQTFAIAWFFYLALRSGQWSRLTILCHLLPAAAVAMIVKTTTPLYCVLPGMMIVVRLFYRSSLLPTGGHANVLGRLIILAFGLCLCALTFAWYWINFEVARKHALAASFSDVALDYGRRSPFGEKLIFWIAAVRDGLFTPYLAGFALVLVIIGTAAWIRRRWSIEQYSSPADGNRVALFAALHVGIIIIALSSAINEETRFLVAATPPVAVVLMWAIAQMRVRALSLVFLLSSLAQWGFVFAAALGIANWHVHYWVVPIERDSGRKDELVRLVAITSSDSSVNYRYNVVGIELPELNANSFAYYAAKNKLKVGIRAHYTSLGYAEKDVEKALRRIEELNTRYFISVMGRDPRPHLAFLNRVSEPVLAQIEVDPSRFVPVPFESRFGVVVFERVPPKIVGGDGVVMDRQAEKKKADDSNR